MFLKIAKFVRSSHFALLAIELTLIVDLRFDKRAYFVKPPSHGM